ncbi:hypothetical protein Pcinc_006029 [Petrolisthes cinctipes]|uniref:SOUL heme-binding protein n=1 Tax=Petrolisthes cinctipes TaxID=88211 RepID=A0AAE1KYF9_PETCI|nr:hypothetical protein Pcinc_006029 [Petrolisthes cinctipes]
MMMKGRVGGLLLVVVVLATVCPAARAASVFTAVSRGFETQEEIKFSSRRTLTDYEERQYPEKKWVCSKQDPGEGQLTVFLRLFAYIDGKNDRNLELVMGIPVSIEARQGEAGGLSMQACFFIPETNQANPPVPIDSSVSIVTRPAMTVFTREFGGYASDEHTWQEEATELTRLVQAENININPNIAFWNAYDPPLKFWGRRNEVWLVKA